MTVSVNIFEVFEVLSAVFGFRVVELGCFLLRLKFIESRKRSPVIDCFFVVILIEFWVEVSSEIVTVGSTVTVVIVDVSR